VVERHFLEHLRAEIVEIAAFAENSVAVSSAVEHSEFAEEHSGIAEAMVAETADSAFAVEYSEDSAVVASYVADIALAALSRECDSSDLADFAVLETQTTLVQYVTDSQIVLAEFVLDHAKMNTVSDQLQSELLVVEKMIALHCATFAELVLLYSSQIAFAVAEEYSDCATRV